MERKILTVIDHLDREYTTVNPNILSIAWTEVNERWSYDPDGDQRGYETVDWIRVEIVGGSDILINPRYVASIQFEPPVQENG